MNRDEAFQQLARSIAGDGGLLLDGWTHLVLVTRFEAGGSDLTGFCYLDGGRSVPVSPVDFSIFGALSDLRSAMAEADQGRGWQTALFRVERATGSFTMDADYDNVDRWAITPKNYADRAREFAPA